MPSSTLVAQVERVPHADGYAVLNKVCSLTETGIAAIVGPTSEITSLAVRSVSDVLEIPHVEVGPDLDLRHDALTINLWPRPEIMAKAFLDVATGLGWESFALAYENNEGVAQFQEFFKQLRHWNWDLKLYQFDAQGPFRDTFYNIKKAKQMNIILDVRHENLLDALKQVS